MLSRQDQLELDVARDHRRAESRRVMRSLRADAARIADHFGLEYRSIRAERREVKEHFGVCYANGEIRIRLRHATTGRLLRYSSLIDTLCHELAHLKHFDHSEHFEAFFQQLLAWARMQGIYRPRAPRDPLTPELQRAQGPRQLPLFGDPRLRALIAGR